MTRYFAMLADESIVDLGEHATFDDADQAAPENTCWIFTEEGLRHFVAQAISIAMGGRV